MIAQGRIHRGSLRASTTILLVLLASLLALPASAQLSTGKCRAPIAWRIGVVDREFDVDPQKLHRMASAAALRWNRAAGRAVFIDNPNARFTINLRYGLRQEAAEAIKDLQVNAAQRKVMLDEMMRVMDQLVRSYNHNSARFGAKVKRSDRETLYILFLSSAQRTGGSPGHVAPS